MGDPKVKEGYSRNPNPYWKFSNMGISNPKLNKSESTGVGYRSLGVDLLGGISSLVALVETELALRNHELTRIFNPIRGDMRVRA